MRLPFGTRVYWRAQDEVQVGQPGELHAVFKGLDDAETKLLTTLPMLSSRPLYMREAQKLGVRQERATRFLEVLRGEGLLLDSKPASAAGGVGVALDGYRERLGLDAVWDRRAGGSVVVVGSGSVACALAQALREEGLSEVKHLRTSQVWRLEGFSPQLVVFCSQGAMVPDGARRALGAGTAFLRVVTSGSGVEVGPLTSPGVNACNRCVDLWRAGLDSGWPVLATQISGGPFFEVDSAVVRFGVALALREVLAFVCGDPVGCGGAVLEVDGRWLGARRREVKPHPQCGCVVEVNL